jgi:demethoxyubiquinone hydroxylase (CLK1/Coq7/Cat5 family)
MYNILKIKLGDKEAKALTEYVENHVEKSFEKEIDRIATKEDLLKLDVKLSDTKSEIIKWMFIFWIGQIVVTLAILVLRK